MTELAKKQGVKSFVGLQDRMSPTFAKVNLGPRLRVRFLIRSDIEANVECLFQAKEIVRSGVLGRITSTTVLGMDSQLMNFPEKARYINGPTSGLSIYFPFASLLQTTCFSFPLVHAYHNFQRLDSA